MTRTSSAQSTETNGRRQRRTLRSSQRKKKNSSNGTRTHRVAIVFRTSWTPKLCSDTPERAPLLLFFIGYPFSRSSEHRSHFLPNQAYTTASRSLILQLCRLPSGTATNSTHVSIEALQFFFLQSFSKPSIPPQLYRSFSKDFSFWQ